MLPPSLVSTYQQYKNDTDSIAGWLASTAKATGYVSDPLTQQLPKGTSTRLKGKARAEAKKKQASSSSKPAPVNKYIIKIKDFIPLAEFIASKHDISIPNSLITTLRRVIIARGGFSGMLAEKGAIADEISDVNHGYFVGVLEKVQEILKPQTNTTSTSSTGSSPKASKDKSRAGVTDDEFSNQFAGLKVYEPSEDFLNAPDIERPKVREGDNVTYEAEPPSSLEDLYVAVTLLINDINKIRSRIEWIWTNYRDGFFELAACAVTTNTAIDLARKLMEDVVPMFKDHGGLWKVLNQFHIVQVMMKGYEPFSHSPNGADNFNYDTYDIADGTYILTCRILDAFTRVVQPGAIPLYKEGMFGYYDPRSARDSKSGYQKFEEDRVLLMSFFTELMAVERGVGDYPVEDEFLRGIKELAKTKEVPFYLVFAAQIFLDIHYILRGNASRGFETLQMNLQFLDREIEEHFEFHKDLKIDNWPTSHNQMIRHLQAKIQYILGDPVYKAKTQAYHALREPVPASMEPNRILKMSPVLCGLLLYHFRSSTWEIGIRLADAWGSITYSLHLYNSLQSEKLISNCWPDMDLVWAVLGDKFFVGDTPKAPEDYFKKFSLQMGTTAAAFTSKRRKNTALTSRSGPRGIKDGIPVSSMFMNRYRHGTGQVDWTAEHIAQIVDLSLWETEGLEEEGTLMLGQVDTKKLKQKSKSIKANKFSELPPEQLIRALMFALQGEALELALPYTAMHRECWALLRAVRKQCDPLLRQMFTSKYMERETELPFVVGWIFTALWERRDTKLLAEAGVAVADFIRSDGNTVLDLLKSIGVPVVFGGEEVV
ncbi:uncharacterized protein F4817DRAFT_348063 [Daldinia loculata]|uniref:uncharacterized protein n=1 Tax=Daldinia loculata TaxID=103429 RepID=UPI0020C58736|nr:uncharacterized protein F4817DRAFT_348063 [Daldinia loculata]KAI1643963.1 hypothetical protein F4817DRAFT_348063 [Daldinia loculata]